MIRIEGCYPKALLIKFIIIIIATSCCLIVNLLPNLTRHHHHYHHLHHHLHPLDLQPNYYRPFVKLISAKYSSNYLGHHFPPLILSSPFTEF